MARNQYLTYSQLECPPSELQCLLYPTTTTAKLPLKGFPGQLIFVTDMISNDSSMGVLLSYNPITQSWKKLY